MRAVRLLCATALLIGSPLSAVAEVGATTPAAAEPPPTFVTEWGDFQEPSGVAVDPNTGDVYVTGWDDLVRKFTSTGAFITDWEASGQSRGVAVDGDGNVFVTDRYNALVRKFTSTGTLITSWGAYGTEDGEFIGPTGVATDPQSGDVYIADLGNNRIQKFTSTGIFITSWSGGIRYPEDVAVDPVNGDVYVVEASWDPHRVWKFTSDGTYLDDWGTIGSGNGEFNQPMALAVDHAGNVYVADSGNDRIQKFAADGTFITKWGTGGGGKGEFDWPSGVAVDASGDVFVADTMNDRMQKFGYQGRPDGRMRRGGGALVGDDVYNSTGKHQTRTGSTARGKSVTYFASIQNDAAFAEQLRLRGEGSTSRFAVVYRSPAGDNITKQITAGTYTTPTLETGAVYQIKITVTVRNKAAPGASLARLLTTTSTGYPKMKDAVRFTTSCR